MAEQGSDSEDLTASLKASSDWVFDIYCDVCFEEDNHLEAIGFCVECGEYLCTDCVKAHAKQRPSRNHVVQTKSQMPRRKPSLLPPPRAKPTTPSIKEMCDLHPEQRIKYYCRDDGTLACTVCLVKHRQCRAVDHISELSEHLLDSEEYQHFTVLLTTLKTKSKDVIKNAKKNTKQAETVFSDVATAKQDLRRKMVQAFDKLDTDIQQKTQSIKSADVKKMNDIGDKGKDVLSEVETISAEVKTLQSSTNLSQLFVRMIKLEDTVQALNSVLDEAAASNSIVKYMFEPGTAAQEFLDKPDSIGKLSTETPVNTLPESQTLSKNIPVRQMICDGPSTDTTSAPANVMQHVEARTFCPGNMVPMMPGAGAQQVPPATMHTPTTAAPDPPAALLSLQSYEVPGQRVYDSWPQEEDKTKRRHRATGLLQDTIYEKINDDLLKTRQVQPLPPRDYYGGFGHRDDAESSATQDKPKAPPRARPGSDKGLKLFNESAGRRREESQGEEEYEAVGELGGCRKVKVKFARSISKDSLELFFDSEKRSGGGDVVNIIVDEDNGEALLEFKDSSVVDRILHKQSTKKLVLSGTTLHVQKYDPPFDKRRFFIRGVSKRTSKESLRIFFEARCGRPPQSIVDGETPGTALLMFDTELDYRDLQYACQQKALEGAHLKCEQVKVTRSVKVTGCWDYFSETLTYYLENKRRSQGGDVEEVTRQEGTGAYIVTFKHVADCERVCGQATHTINGVYFSVCPYYPCLDMDDNLRFTVPTRH